MTFKIGPAIVLAVLCGPMAGRLLAQAPPRTLYTSATAREQALRAADQPPSLSDLRAAARQYEDIVRLYPTSGYSDNALWQAASLELLAFDRFHLDVDRRAAIRLLTQLRDSYPTSSLIPRAQAALDAAPAAAPASVATLDPVPPAPSNAAVPTQPPSGAIATTNAIREITRTPLPNGVRVVIQLDTESPYHAERLQNPARVFFDLRNARPVQALLDATLTFPDAVVREIRLGRHPQNTTRIVMDLEGVDSYSVFTLYNPFRLVIDFKSNAVVMQAPAPSPPPPPSTVHGVTPVAALAVSAPPPMPAAASLGIDAVMDARPTSPPTPPSANSNGQFSIARQLGLGVSRIVIDAGHGGHDPGAQSNGLKEAELVLDVARRLSALIQKQTTIEVVMTRAEDVFIPLEERTAIANREGADLFLSIHANASRNTEARGIETYFLNFASNPDAEAVAARENSASGRTMHNLPDIVKAIALNNKLDESRDFAELVQRAMVRKLSARNKQLRDLGVKQAPFVVLIGAGMPSVLAEISFLTHRQEGQLLKTAAYRQQVAEALLDAVLRYQQSLKRIKSAAAQVGAR